MHAALRGGGKVAVTDIDSIRGQQLVAKIAAAGGQAAYLTQDVTDEARWPEVVAEIEDCYGRLDDVLVVNAGIGIMVPSMAV
ncbi:MAG TPA: SDR family NAD(P)-dependent oxidoreductase [Stellaceae bacterium]|jgi:NAD(P)-dependent dehydrogenase (short-subunit alcohol dehydrogenase family)|nr:SDR family NAD(P)-dependent oxidoreductase [Stellaceae bacterium]